MILSSALASTSHSVARPLTTAHRLIPQTHSQLQSLSSSQTRARSTSADHAPHPYGRTHIWKHRPRTLPAPCVPHFPQRIVRSDGATIIHYGTSPRSSLRLTRDTSSNPLWNVGGQAGSAEEEDAVTGRLGRFRRRFEGLGEGDGIDWTSEAAGESMENVQQMVEGKGKGKSS